MKKERTGFIIMLVITLAFASFSLACIIGLITDGKYPNKEDLTYEECTFIKYEYKVSRSTKSKTEMYYIYVEEYDLPLRIDNIVFHKANKELLDRISTGEKVLVSVLKNKNHYDLYSFSYDGQYVLSYDDYLLRHNSNNIVGIIVCSVFSCVALAFFVGEIIYYKKTGMCIPI